MFGWFLTDADGRDWSALPQAAYAGAVTPHRVPAGGCGPDRQAGRLFTAHADPTRQAWTWQRARYTPGLWIGWPTGRPPGPLELARDVPMRGLPVTLKDGAAWLIPVVCPATADRSAMMNRAPASLADTLSDPAPVEPPDELRELCAGLLARFEAGTLDATDDATTCRVAFLALEVGYRIGRDEADALKLFGDTLHTVAQVAAATIDLVARIPRKAVQQ